MENLFSLSEKIALLPREIDLYFLEELASPPWEDWYLLPRKIGFIASELYKVFYLLIHKATQTDNLF